MGLEICFPRSFLCAREWDLIWDRKHSTVGIRTHIYLRVYFSALKTLIFGQTERLSYICLGLEESWSQRNRGTEPLVRSTVRNKESKDGNYGLTCIKLEKLIINWLITATHIEGELKRRLLSETNSLVPDHFYYNITKKEEQKHSYNSLCNSFY